MKEVERALEPLVLASLEAFPVVYIAGPRQSGKTTLAKRIVSKRLKEKKKAQYITFDDVTVRLSAKRDPEGFLRSLEGFIVLDEIQMVPELFRILKIVVDKNRALPNGGKGRFLLTGSASVMALPELSDALVGRMVLHTLLPFSIREIKESKKETFIDRVFGGEWTFNKVPNFSTLDAMVEGSFPELFFVEEERLRSEWCNSYINTILQRDVHALMEVEKVGSLLDMLRLFATCLGGVLNEASLSRNCRLNHVTAKKYRLLLESLFLIFSTPAWSYNLGKRVIKSPKIYLCDSNIIAYLLNVDMEGLSSNLVLFGQVLKNFVAMELFKQSTFSRVRSSLYHYRTTSLQEIDFILEGPAQSIVGIEVKGAKSVKGEDFRHLIAMQKELGERFHRGVVLYQGDTILPFGENLWALPISIFWD